MADKPPVGTADVEVLRAMINAHNEIGGYQPGDRVSANVEMPRLPPLSLAGMPAKDLPLALVRVLRHLGAVSLGDGDPGAQTRSIPPHWPQR